MKLKTRRRVYLREAALMLALTKLAVRFVPTARLVAWASRTPRAATRFAMWEAGWIASAVETVGAKPWMRALCLPRALAAQAMLRRRGIASRLCVGVAREGATLAAHAWIELDHDIIVGGSDAPRFTRLVEFGENR
jgi:hypothetical protein